MLSLILGVHCLFLSFVGQKRKGILFRVNCVGFMTRQDLNAGKTLEI